MNKLKTVWVIAERTTAIGELTAAAGEFGDHVSLLYAGKRENARNANTAYYLGDTEDKFFLSFIPSIVAMALEMCPQLVLLETSRNGRQTAAALGVAMNTAVMTDISSLTLKDGIAQATRMVYGGAAVKTEEAMGSTSVVCVGSAVFDAGVSTPVSEIKDVAMIESGIRFVKKVAREKQTVNLPSAKRIVGVGRGIGSEEYLPMIRTFADAIGAEVGCSRPVAEESHWMPRECYMGVSGAMVKPDVYLAVGISGQVQHMVGINKSGTIIAINKDKNAPIFSKCDYGLVGDFKVVIPALLEKFK